MRRYFFIVNWTTGKYWKPIPGGDMWVDDICPSALRRSYIEAEETRAAILKANVDIKDKDLYIGEAVIEPIHATNAPKRVYRCGYCGTPCDEHGVELKDLELINKEDLDKADLVEGLCCRSEVQERHMERVTRDMALDACDPSLEGTWIEW